MKHVLSYRKGHPNPMLLRDKYLVLDGEWDFCFDPNDIGFYDFEPESIILIDEVGMVWDNRDYKNFKPQTRDFFKLQRHAKLKIYLFSQTFDIDKKLRDLTDEMYLLTNRLRVWSSARRIDKTITISKSVDAEGNKVQFNR